MFYFAYVDANNVCQDVYAMPTDLSSTPGYITITEAQYTSRSVVGQIYTPETGGWSNPPEWVCNATQVQYGEGNESVNDKLDEIGTGLADLSEAFAALDTGVRPLMIVEMHNGKIDNTTGEETESTSRISSDFIPIQSGKTYYQTNDLGYFMYVTCYTADKTFIYRKGDFASGEAIDCTRENAAFIRLSSHSGENSLSNVFRLYDADPTATDEEIYSAEEVDGFLSAKADAVHTHTAADISGVVKTINGTAADENGNVTIAVNGGGMTAGEILEAVKTVDGQNSGLDADLLDGHNSDYFATAEQLTGKADADHNHEGYVTAEALSGYVTADQLSTKADANHAHNDYITLTTYANGMSNKADVNHSHSGYASSGHSHTEYASSGHSHTASSIGAATSNHTHSGYASSTHTHSGYLPTSGGTVSGDLNVTGILRVNGQQSVYDSGSMVTLSTNNRETMIAGSKIYSKVAISVSSDRRLKENIKEVSADDMTKFINGLGIKTFNYIGNDEECIGVIAQEVTESNPELAKYFVRQDEEGYYSVKASDLVFPLIATVQKLAQEVEELKAGK